MLETIRRDVAMLWRGLVLGETPPFLATTSTQQRTYSMPSRALTVTDVSRTDQDVTLWLATADGSPLTWTAGQFLTLLVDVGGASVRRAYSLSSDPTDSTRGRITVRSIPDGLASTALYRDAKPGMTLRALGPSGRFVWPQPGTPTGDMAPLLLIGGGSGLTPLMSILYAALGSGHSDVTLLYANRPGDPGLYPGELTALAERHPGLSLVRVDGHLSADAVSSALTDGAEVYICGPQGLMDVALKTLADVPAERVHTEAFHSVSHLSQVTEPQPAVFHVGEQRFETTVAAGETLLEAGLRAGAPLPFSCAMGGCGACRMHVKTGQVHAEEPNCLSGAEASAGDVLTCVSRPTSPVELEAPVADATS